MNALTFRRAAPFTLSFFISTVAAAEPTIYVKEKRTHSSLTMSSSNYAQSGLELSHFNRLEDLAFFSPGIQPSSDTAGLNTSLSIRGFKTNGGNLYANGHRDIYRFYPRDLATIEKVTIERGNNSVLYGSGSPGGAIHYTTKQPKDTERTTFKAAVGSNNKRRLEVDSTGSAEFDNRLRYRVIGVYQEANTFLDNVNNDRELVYTNLKWHHMPDGYIRWESEFAHLKNPFSFGTVLSDGDIMYGKSYAGPRNHSDRYFWRNSLYLSQPLSSAWKLNALSSYATMRRDDTMHGFFYKLDEEHLAGFYAESDNTFWQSNTKISAEGRVKWLTKHYIETGFELNKLDNRLKMDRVINSYTLTPSSPRFPEQVAMESPQKRGFDYQDHDKSLFFIDELRILANWNLNIGGRYSKYTSYNEETEVADSDESVFTKNIGVQWNATEAITSYGSYTESYEPNSGIDKNGQFFEPKRGEQLELGLLWTQNSSEFNVTIYRLTQNNLLTPDTTDPDYLTTLGERETLGGEISSTWTPYPQLAFDFAYSHLDTKYIEDNAGLKGNQAAGVARNTASLGINWSLSQPSISMFARIKGVSDRYGDAQNSFKLSGYGKLDAGVVYQKERLQAHFTIDNLLDKDYIAASSAEDDMYQGKPREFSLGVEVDW